MESFFCLSLRREIIGEEIPSKVNNMNGSNSNASIKSTTFPKPEIHYIIISIGVIFADNCEDY